MIDRFADDISLDGSDRAKLICNKSIRLDAYIAENTDLSRSKAADMIDGGFVCVNGRAQKKNYKLSVGDRIEMVIPKERECAALPENIPLDIVYQDEHIIVVNKKRGMVVHPAAGNYEGTLVNALLYHCKDSLSGINGVLRPGIIHRIDKNTSGLLAVAKTEAAHIGLALQIKEHSFDRVYHAIVHGTPKEEAGMIDCPIGRSRNNRKVMGAFPRDSKEAGIRNALTHYRIIEGFGKYSYIECRLETGRTHQIRVHMKTIGHPIVGDDVYCPDKLERFGLNGQCLHAKTIGFTHPITKERLFFDSPLPDYFENTLNKIRKITRGTILNNTS